MISTSDIVISGVLSLSCRGRGMSHELGCTDIVWFMPTLPITLPNKKQHMCTSWQCTQ